MRAANASDGSRIQTIGRNASAAPRPSREMKSKQL